MSSEKVLKTIEICRDYLDEAVEALARAFEDDPLMRYCFSGPAYFDSVREVHRFVCEARLELGWPIIGTVSGKRITGVACVSPPEKRDWPASLAEKYERFQARIGDESAGKMRRLMGLSKKHVPAQSHYYLAALGVRPEWQGKGVGRILLDAVHKMSESHKESTGVYLETATEANVRLYEHFGYRLIARDRLDDAVDLWYLFRANKAGS